MKSRFIHEGFPENQLHWIPNISSDLFIILTYPGKSGGNPVCRTAIFGFAGSKLSFPGFGQLWCKPPLIDNVGRWRFFDDWFRFSLNSLLGFGLWFDEKPAVRRGKFTDHPSSFSLGRADVIFWIFWGKDDSFGSFGFPFIGMTELAQCQENPNHLENIPQMFLDSHWDKTQLRQIFKDAG